MRRLLLADSWRPHVLEALANAVEGGSVLLHLQPTDNPPPQVRSALAAFSVLGGHVQSLVPGARVTILPQGGGQSQQATVLAAGGGAAGDVSVVTDAGAQQWRSSGRKVSAARTRAVSARC